MPELDQSVPFDDLTPLFDPCVVMPDQQVKLSENDEPYFASAEFLQPDTVSFRPEIAQPLPAFEFVEPAPNTATTWGAQTLMYPGIPQVFGNEIQTPSRPIKIPRVVKKTDSKALERRARNAESVRRSRRRTKERITELEQLVSHLQRENATLKQE